MRVIADIFTDHKLFGLFVDEGNPDNEERIIEIDSPKEVGLNIFLRDRKNTIITISEEDLLSLGYEKLIDA